MIVENLHEGIGLAGVIDVMRTVAAAAAIKTPAVIQRADSQAPATCPAVCFRIRDPLSGVLRDLTMLPEAYRGKATFAFNVRARDVETVSKLHFH